MDPLHCLAIVAGICFNDFMTIDGTEARSWPISVVTAHLDGGHVELVSTDNLFSPYREALPDACDASGAGCIHYAKRCQTGPGNDPWVRCKIEYVRADDEFYRTLELYALNAAAMDALAKQVGFVMGSGDRRGVIPLIGLTEIMDGVPSCRNHPTRGQECRGELWKDRELAQ